MDLTLIGLTLNESKVYEKLVLLGKSAAGKISNESGVSQKKIYSILSTLEYKGLVKVIPEKIKKYAASSPEELKKLLTKKSEEIQELSQEINKLKQAYNLKEKEPVLIAKGKKNFYLTLNEMIIPKKSSYSIKYSSEFNPKFVKNVKDYLKRKVEVKELARYDDETKKSVNNWMKVHKNIRLIKNEGVSMNLVDDEEILISLIKSNVLMLIRDKPFVKIMKELFINYYNNAQKIE